MVWKSVPTLSAVVYEPVPAFGVSLVLVIVVSLLTRPPDNVRADLAAPESGH